jgi:hypothetical protein
VLQHASIAIKPIITIIITMRQLQIKVILKTLV